MKVIRTTSGKHRVRIRPTSGENQGKIRKTSGKYLVRSFVAVVENAELRPPRTSALFENLPVSITKK
jgi:hypothetical protein